MRIYPHIPFTFSHLTLAISVDVTGRMSWRRCRFHLVRFARCYQRKRNRLIRSTLDRCSTRDSRRANHLNAGQSRSAVQGRIYRPQVLLLLKGRRARLLLIGRWRSARCRCRLRSWAVPHGWISGDVRGRCHRCGRPRRRHRRRRHVAIGWTATTTAGGIRAVRVLRQARARTGASIVNGITRSSGRWRRHLRVGTSTRTVIGIAAIVSTVVATVVASSGNQAWRLFVGFVRQSGLTLLIARI